MSHNVNIVVWFEIPAQNFERAVMFYQAILDVSLDIIEMAGLQQGLFPHDDKSLVSGAIVSGLDYTPSQQGNLIYLHGGNDLSKVLSRVEAAGGSVVMPKTHLGDEIGYIAHIVDSEGNKIGVHSMQ